MIHIKCVIVSLAVLLLGNCAPMPMAPINPGAIVHFRNYNDAMLKEDITYRIGDTSMVVVVPAGFVSDHASIPGVLQPYFQRNSKAYQYPAIVHDWLYWNQYPREKADDIFYNAMKECGVTNLDRKAMWAGVHWGGQRAWDENKGNREKGLPRIIPPEYRHTVQWPSSWAQYQKELFRKGVTNHNEPRQKILY